MIVRLEYYKVFQVKTINKTMAFVYRTINDDNSSTSFTPGPGAYFNSKKYKNQP